MVTVGSPKYRKASVVWKGTFQEGMGTMSTESRVLSDTQYSFQTRFGEGIGTNPDELIAASLGSCFSMSLANELGLAGFDAERIETTATSTLEQLEAGWTITRMQLDVRAKVPNATDNDFIDATLAAKTNCPLARLLNTTISMNASLSPENAGLTDFKSESASNNGDSGAGGYYIQEPRGPTDDC